MSQINKYVGKKETLPNIKSLEHKAQLQAILDHFNSGATVVEFVKIDDATFNPIFKIEYLGKVHDVTLRAEFINDVCNYLCSAHAVDPKIDCYIDPSSIAEGTIKIYTQFLSTPV